MKKESYIENNSWWEYEPPATAYDLVGNNLITTFLRPFLYIAIRFYFKHHHKLTVFGYQPSFSQNSYIIVANHSSHLDTALIFSCFPFARTNKIRAVAALDYFFSNTIIRIITHLLCNLIPIKRKSADFIAISMCKRVFKSGGNVIIYPEGTRTRTGKMGAFKPGVGILIKKAKVPVLPIYIKGTYKCLNHKMLLPRAGPIEIRFGSPLEYNTLISGKIDYKKLVERLRNEIINTAQQLY